MFRAPRETIEVLEPGLGAGNSPTWLYLCRSYLPVGNYQDPPQSASNYAPQREPNVSDGSEHIFSMYWEMAGEEDKRMAEGWKVDADRILIFVGVPLSYRAGLQLNSHRPVYSLPLSRH